MPQINVAPVPKQSVKLGTSLITPQVGRVDSARWRGFRQSGPFLALLESVLADCVQLLIAAKTLNPFQQKSTLRNIARRDTDFTLEALSTQSYAIQIESLRKQLAFKLSTP